MLRVLKFALTRLLFAFFRKVILLLKLMASVGGRAAESQLDGAQHRGRNVLVSQTRSRTSRRGWVCVRARGYGGSQLRKTLRERKKKVRGDPRGPLSFFFFLFVVFDQLFIS